MSNIVFVGSAYPNSQNLRSGIQRVTAAFGEEPVLRGCAEPDSPPWMIADPGAVYELFHGLVAADDGIIFNASGGTGAARVTQRWRFKDRPGASGPKVCGSSDGFVYPLMAWLWNTGESYYCPNVAEGLLDTDMEVVDVWGDSLYGEYPGVIATYFEASTSYKVFPVCAGVLRQSSTAVKKAVIDRLKKEPYLLLLEDNYPSNEVGLLAFYEDLTGLWDILGAICQGGGAVGVSSICEILGVSPMGILRNVLDNMPYPDVPAFYGLDFGHRDGPLSVIRFGSDWHVSYFEETGLSVTVE